MKTKSRAAQFALLVSIIAPFPAQAELVRFIRIIKNNSVETSFHLG